MRLLISAGLLLTWSWGAYAQHRGGFSPAGSPVVRTGPPTGVRPQGRPWGVGSIGARPPGPSWGVRPPNGVGPPTGVRPPGAWCGRGRFNHWGGGVTSFVPYVAPYPVYLNGGYSPGFPNDGYYPEIPYSYDQQFAPPMAGMPPQMLPPPVAMNQYPPEPSPSPSAEESAVHSYQAPTSPRPEPDEPQRPTLFIALKDGWVYTASDYWVEHGTLHYITRGGKHNQVSLNLVDRQTSARLNSGQDFHSPAP